MRLSEIVGQRQIKDSIHILLDSVRGTDKVCPGILFEGFSGGGKSTFARAIAYEIGKNFREVNCGCLSNTAETQIRFMACLEELKHGDVLFMDETHLLPKKIQEILYSALEEGYITFGGETFGARIEIKPFTLVGATTHMGALSLPLQGRFKYIFRINEYEVSEIEQLLRTETAKLVEVYVDCAELAKFCRGNPREAKKYLDWVYRYSTAKDLRADATTIRSAMQQLGIHAYGLTSHDLKYVRELAKRKVAGVRMLANTINVEEGTVKKNIEPYLLKLGVISIMPSMQGKRAINLERARELGLL